MAVRVRVGVRVVVMVRVGVMVRVLVAVGGVPVTVATGVDVLLGLAGDAEAGTLLDTIEVSITVPSKVTNSNICFRVRRDLAIKSSLRVL